MIPFGETLMNRDVRQDLSVFPTILCRINQKPRHISAAAAKINAIKMNTQKQTYPRGSLLNYQQIVFLIGVPPFV